MTNSVLLVSLDKDHWSLPPPSAAAEDFEATTTVNSLGWKFLSPPRREKGIGSTFTEFGGEVDEAGYAVVIPECSISPFLPTTCSAHCRRPDSLLLQPPLPLLLLLNPTLSMKPLTEPTTTQTRILHPPYQFPPRSSHIAQMKMKVIWMIVLDLALVSLVR